MVEQNQPWAGRWTSAKRRPPEFPQRLVDGEEQADSLYAERLRNFATDWVQFFIDFYEKRARRCRLGAFAIRFVAFGGMVLGSMILVSRLLSSSNQQLIMTKLFGIADAKEVPAEIGLILFALAAALMAADKFGNISENWMRYIIAMMSLQRSLVEFQLAGVQALEPSVLSVEPPPNSTEPIIGPHQKEYERIKTFLAAIFDLVQHETEEWANEFRKNQSDLESYLKIQNEAKAQQQLKRP